MYFNTLPHMRFSYVRRIFYFLLLTFVGLMMALIAMTVVLRGGIDTLSIRLGTVVQDLLLFIVPAIAASVLLSNNGGRLLCVDRMPELKAVSFALLAMFCSIPLMNAVVAWNESLSLPQALSPVEAWMRQAEEAAQGQVDILLGGISFMDLTVSLLIVAVLAGFSEELFFRGAMQRILSSGTLSPHAAIWITAFLFSLFHMQFFGFFPRFILGAFFGYLLYWSGSLWVSAIAHAFNNAVVVCVSWHMRNASGDDTFDLNKFGDDSWLLILASAILTVIVICKLKDISKSRNNVTAEA